MAALILSLLCLLIPFAGFGQPPQPIALVSLAPYRTFVKKIAGDFLQVEVMVPPGASAHSYEPTPKQMAQAVQADLWFFVGEPFEKKALQAIRPARPELEIVDLKKGIPLLHEHCCCEGCADLHIWLSPKLAKTQAQTIANALAKRYPERGEIFKANLDQFLAELTALDQYIRETLAPVQKRFLMVSHPAYGYFCQEYEFKQIPIEFEGRDPTQKQMTALFQQAKRDQIRFILTQPQYSDKAAKLVSSQLDAKLISVDPYSENYVASLRHIATVIREND